METAIETSVVEHCRCGSPVAIDSAEQAGNCERCGQTVRLGPQYNYDPIELLNTIGIECKLDYDDQVILVHDRDYPIDELAIWARKHQSHLRSTLQARRRTLLSVHVGGPKDGESHQLDAQGPDHPVVYWKTTGSPPSTVWFIYAAHSHADPRLYFRGWASSRAKALAGDFLPDPP